MNNAQRKKPDCIDKTTYAHGHIKKIWCEHFDKEMQEFILAPIDHFDCEWCRKNLGNTHQRLSIRELFKQIAQAWDRFFLTFCICIYNRIRR